jgi:hypothetical protein
LQLLFEEDKAEAVAELILMLIDFEDVELWVVVVVEDEADLSGENMVSSLSSMLIWLDFLNSK